KTLIVGRDNTSTTFAGTFTNTTNAARIIKAGTGTMTLSGSNTYSGSTTVSGGSLIVIRTNLTATITPTSISVAFSNTPATNTPYTILTGPLAGGPYSTVTVSSPSGYNGTVDTNSGTISVTAASSANPPTITSTNAFTGTVGVAFSNNITATGYTPITFSGTGLPGGLSVASNGAITGTPTNAGPFNATLTATNAAGTNTQSVTFTIAKGTPSIITLPTASDLTAGQALVSSSLTGGNGSVVGAFAWTDSSIIPQVGTSSRSVTFTPTDTANYNTATTSVSVTVKPAGESIGNFLPAGQPTNSETVGKYLIGGATNFNASSESPLVTASSTHLVLTAIIRTNDAGYSSNQVVGQWVTNLSDYSGLAAGSNEVIGAPSANQTNVPTGFQRRDFSVNRDNGTNRLFLRLKATLQP
ncbi:MAG: hypothetical protein EBV83_09430, partial [Verrucomicrobia bacterium]|nr:hypothetical protein [Verrucomicrobiota bacterium]